MKKTNIKSDNNVITNLNANLNIKINKDDINALVERKLLFFNDVIQKTIINVQRNKLLGILNISDINSCINLITIINEKIKSFSRTLPTETLLNNLQIINNDISGLFKIYGTEHSRTRFASIIDPLRLEVYNNY